MASLAQLRRYTPLQAFSWGDAANTKFLPQHNRLKFASIQESFMVKTVKDLRITRRCWDCEAVTKDTIFHRIEVVHFSDGKISARSEE